MATLTNSTIATTYTMLLKMADTGIDGTLNKIESGDADDGALALSTTAIGIDTTDKMHFDGANGDFSASNTYIHESGTDQLDFVVGGDVNGFVLKESGNETKVGIGTNAPGEALTITTTDQVRVHLDSPNSAKLRLDRGATNDQAFVIHELAGSPQWVTGVPAVGDIAGAGYIIGPDGNTAKLIVLPSGNVGIGDDNPQALLDIYKTDTVTSAVTNTHSHFNMLLRNHSVTTNAFAGIAFDVSQDTANSDAIGAAIKAIRDTTASSTTTAHEANLAFFTNTDQDNDLYERMRIQYDGNVGIGTTTPVKWDTANSMINLQIGTSTCLVASGSSPLGKTYLSNNLYYDDVDNRFEFMTGSSEGAYLYMDDNGRIEFAVSDGAGAAGAEVTGLKSALMIFNNGNVGIGIAAPDKPLHVAGETYIDSYLSLRTTDDQANKWVLYTDTNDYFSLNYNGADNAEVVVDTSGQVGIGTAPLAILHTKPTQAFSTAPTTYTGDAIFIDSGSSTKGDNASGAGIVFSKLGDQNDQRGAAIACRQFGSDEDSTGLSFYSNTGSSNTGPLVLGMVLNDSQNVGIGIADPNQALHVYRDDTDAIAYIQAINLADTEGAYMICAGTGGGVTTAAYFGTHYSTDTDNSKSDAPCSFMKMEASDENDNYFWVGNDDRFYHSTNATLIGQQTGNTTDGTFSDERAKDISSDIFPYGLDVVNNLTPIKYKWKDGYGITTKNNIGLGAQSVQAIIPEVIEETNTCLDGYDKEGNPKSDKDNKLNIRYGEMIPVLVKAIQELTDKVEALENNNQQGDSSNEQEQQSAGSGDSGGDASSESSGEDSGGVEADSADSSDSASGASEASESSSDDGDQSSGSSGSDSSDDSEGGSGGDDSTGEGEPSEEWTKDQLKAYMDSNSIEYNSGDTKGDLLAKILAAGE